MSLKVFLELIYVIYLIYIITLPVISVSFDIILKGNNTPNIEYYILWLLFR